VFQAKLRGWRRLAAGLVLVPGLTGLGADALGFLGRAAGQDRPAANARADEARELMRQAAEALDAKDHAKARELVEKAQSLNAPVVRDDVPEIMPPKMPKPAAKAPAKAPAPAPARPATTDPKVLLEMAKQAMEKGDIDRAQDLATQAQAHGSNVRWGLFDDTPASVLKEVQKSKGRRHQVMADRLMAEARALYEKQAANKADRVANLMAAEEKARQSAALHGEYSMWDFSERPADLIAEIRRCRDKEKLAGVKPSSMPKSGQGLDAMAQTPSGRQPTAGKKPIVPAGKDTPYGDYERPASADAMARKKAAVALMQEGKAFAVAGEFAEAKQRYMEAARQNAWFGRDDDTPETELAKLNVAAQHRIGSMVAEARKCVARKDEPAARSQLEKAHQLAMDMGLDAGPVNEAFAKLPSNAGPPPVVRTGANKEPVEPPVIRSGKQETTAEAPVIRSGKQEGPGEAAPAPIIRSGPPPMPTPKEDIPLPIIRTGPRPGEGGAVPIPPAIDLDPPIVAPPAVKVAGGEDTASPEKTVKPPVVTGPGEKTMPLLPPIPTIDDLANTVKPPMAPEASPDKGLELLKLARTEHKKGDTEAARKIVIEVLSGPYACKDEALAILKSIEVSENERKITTARKAFENGMEAYHTHNYAQALAIFKQIDGTLLSSKERKQLAEMIATATAKQMEMKDATAARNGEPLPTAPKKVPGVPDLPGVGPAPTTKVGSDNLLKQQEALAQVEFQKLRSRALKIETEATARFGRGETDAALQDLQNFVAEVKATGLEPSKKNLLVRPIEARMDRLRILKHQTDFLTKEARDRRNWRADMTQEALAKQKKQEEVAMLMKQATKLMDEAKYKEAYAKVQMAHSLEPDDASVNATLKIARQNLRLQEVRDADDSQEQFNYKQMNSWHQFPRVDDKDPLLWSDDKEYRNRVMTRKPGSVGVMRSRSEAEKLIERKMSTPLSVNFKAMPLDSVVEHLQTMTQINFDLDLQGLKDAGIDPKQPITANFVKEMSLKSALGVICRQAQLTHVIEHEAIRITTPKRASGRQIMKALSVGDLVIPPQTSVNNPATQFSDTLAAVKNQALGMSSMHTPSSPRPGSLPGGSGTGSSSMDLPGTGGRIRNNQMDGGAGSNNGSANGTLEKELIRLITNTIRPDSWAQLGGEGTIEYYPIGLALVINQSPEVIEEVERLLESLRKLQDLEVSIEVKVVSLSETFFERIGVDFAMGIPTNASPVGGPLTGTQIGGRLSRNFGGNVLGLQLPGVPTPDLDIPIRATSFPRAVPPFGGFNNTFTDGGVSLGLAFLSECQVQMFLEAAQGDTRTNVMHAPKLTALNGTSASMTVGDFQFFLTGITPVQVAGQLVFVPQNVPFLTGTAQPIPPNLSIQNGNLNFTPTSPQTPGLGLFIQPVVSADRRFVRLNIQQSFTSLISGIQQVPITTIITPQFENGGTGQPVPFTQFLQQPRFSNLETQTVVVVPDGGTVVMGGLKYMTEGRNEFGPPVLSKIPYLNRLFKNVAYGREGRSILIMVTPRVIINREEQERQTGVKDDDFVGLLLP